MFPNVRLTKPQVFPTLIDRPRLYRRLDQWTEKRAIVIYAPTGYGKSSLISRWIDCSGHARRAAWLSLEEDDNDPRQFALDLTSALDRILPGALALVQPILEHSEGTVERVLTRLFSTYWDEASAEALPADQHTLLVLDDLHRINSSAVERAIRMILEEGPPNLHLLLLARQRTTLPLARLFAHGGILTLGVEELRFTAPEISEYLLGHGFQHPTEDELAQLAERSEGWVTALQLAVLVLQGRTNVSELIQVMHGKNIWLAEYLTDEVLSQQTPALRHFLLQTSILDAFNVSLCVAVTGIDDAYARLDEVARKDLFLIALDEKATWFRYHHLFREMLQHRLHAQTEASAVAGLHRRAADWLLAAGDAPGAIRHRLAAGDKEQATALVESQMRAILLQEPYQARTLLALLPDDLLRRSPQLMLDRCRLAALLDDKTSATYIKEAEHTLQTLKDSDPDAARHHAEWLVLRAGSLFIQRDLAATADAVGQAQPFSSQLDDVHSGVLSFLQMRLHDLNGRHEEMTQAAEAALAAFERSDFVIGAVALRRELARWAMASGNSDEARRRFEQMFEQWESDRLMGTGEMALAYLFAAENSYWQDRLDEARTYQRLALELAIQLQDPQIIHAARFLGQTLGMDVFAVEIGTQAFLELLSEVNSPAISDFIVEHHIRALIAAGRNDSAWRIAQTLAARAQKTPDYGVRRQQITYLRARIAQGADLAAVTPALAEALNTAREKGNRFDQLQLLALTAWQQVQLHAPGAAATLREAASLARETGYIRALLDIPALVSLLQEQGIALTASPPPPRVARPTGGVTMTDQELRVLELLADDYSYAQISAQLVISINTVRTHVRHVYHKLGANRRDQAVYQATRHGLLPPQVDGR